MAVSQSKAFQVLTIDEMLPILASSYEAGRLVPFIGAGMSRLKLAGWEGFVANLEKTAPPPRNVWRATGGQGATSCRHD
jgi:hypothetical protein